MKTSRFLCQRTTPQSSDRRPHGLLQPSSHIVNIQSAWKRDLDSSLESQFHFQVQPRQEKPADRSTPPRGMSWSIHSELLSYSVGTVQVEVMIPIYSATVAFFDRDIQWKHFTHVRRYESSSRADLPISLSQPRPQPDSVNGMTIYASCAAIGTHLHVHA
jgi:hypothetical protein